MVSVQAAKSTAILYRVELAYGRCQHLSQIKSLNKWVCGQRNENPPLGCPKVSGRRPTASRIMSKTVVEVSSEETKRSKSVPKILSDDRPFIETATSKLCQVSTLSMVEARKSQSVVNERIRQKSREITYHNVKDGVE